MKFKRGNGNRGMGAWGMGAWGHGGMVIELPYQSWGILLLRGNSSVNCPNHHRLKITPRPFCG